MSTYNLIAIRYKKPEAGSVMRTEFSMNQIQEAKDFQAKLVSEGSKILHGYEHIVTIEHGGGEVSRTNYENFGDVNPIEHGGFFISEDFERENCFYVVEINPLPDTENEWVFSSSFIDLDDVSKDDINVAIEGREGVDPELSQKEIVYDIISHFGHNHYSDARQLIISGENKVKEELKSYNILV
jgi:hypothetical protein